jgi:hypothetical protein
VGGVGEQRYKQKQSAVVRVIIVSCLTRIVLQVWPILTSMPLKSERMRTQNKVNVYLSSLMMKVPDHVYVLG